jgi:hypothetical protein
LTLIDRPKHTRHAQCAVDIGRAILRALARADGRRHGQRRCVRPNAFRCRCLFVVNVLLIRSCKSTRVLGKNFVLSFHLLLLLLLLFVCLFSHSDEREWKLVRAFSRRKDFWSTHFLSSLRQLSQSKVCFWFTFLISLHLESEFDPTGRGIVVTTTRPTNAPSNNSSRYRRHSMYRNCIAVTSGHVSAYSYRRHSSARSDSRRTTTRTTT